MARDRFCARCGQKAVPQQVTEEGEDYLVYTCVTHKEIVWKELIPKVNVEEPIKPGEEIGEAETEPAAPTPTPRALN
jgi:hypothetical protein